MDVLIHELATCTSRAITGSNNSDDPAENFRLYDGLGSGDDGVDEDGVMTLDVRNGSRYRERIHARFSSESPTPACV